MDDYMCDRKDRPKALDVLTKELQDFSRYNERLFRDATLLLTMDDFRCELYTIICDL